MLFRFAILAILGAFALACGSSETSVEATSSIYHMSDAEFVLDDSLVPPKSSAQWQPVSLPDIWNQHHPSDREHAWYRFRQPFLPIAEMGAANGESEGMLKTNASYAVFLPQVNMSARVWADFRELFGRASVADIPNDFNRPLLFRLGSRESMASVNWIYVRLARHAYHQGVLGPIEVGPTEILWSRHRLDEFYKIDLPRIATIVVVLSALFSGALWIATKRDSMYGYFAISAACCAVASLNYWIRELPVDRWVWERVVHSAILGFGIGLALWSRRLFYVEKSRVDLGLKLYLGVAVVFVVIIPVRVFYPSVLALHALPAFIPLYAVYLAYKSDSRVAQAERVICSIGAAIGLAFGLHDLFMQFGWLSPDGVHLMPYAMPVVAFIFALSLVVRFTSSLKRIERLNSDLEFRVEAKARELAQNYEQMSLMERDRILLLERERLMREMHDGLGGQLVSALALAESPSGSARSIAVSLRTALADLRTVINSLDPKVADFGTLLGLLRTRIEPLFESNEVQIIWQVGELPPRSNLGPERNLHLLRILQEAFANAVRHSGAENITFATQWADEELFLYVEDDGVGIQADPGIGRGLKNMNTRAQALNARLEILNTGDGTRVELHLPVDT